MRCFMGGGKDTHVMGGINQRIRNINGRSTKTKRGLREVTRGRGRV